METMDKETVPLYKFRIHAHPKRFAFEKGSRLETEKEEKTVYKEEAVPRVRLGSRNRFQVFIAAPEISFCHGERCDGCAQERQRNEYCDCILFIDN